MGKELEGIHQQHHVAHPAGPTGPDWALDFMQQKGMRHQELHGDPQFQEFENVYRNAQQQQGPQLGGKEGLNPLAPFFVVK